VDYEFRWNEWNVQHIAEHGVRPEEVEYLVRRPHRGFPRAIGGKKSLVQGRTGEGRYLQAIYIFSPADVIYVIHARPLTNAEKRKLRRRLK
jgi:uncharacterized DUF497 family protein